VAFQLCPGDEIRPMPPRADRLYGSSITEVRRLIKPKGQEAVSRRIYQTEALTGTSPSYWTTAVHDWAIKHGCVV